MSENKPTVSIIVVTYASMETIEACLESIFASASTLPSQVEVIVVDNASPDDTVKLISERFPKVRLIKNETNIGYARAVNLGLRLSHGEHVFIMNPDCILVGEALSRMLSFAESDRTVGVIGPMLLNADGSLQPSGRLAKKPIHILLSLLGMHGVVEASLLGRNRNYNITCDVEEVSGAAMFCRREAIESVGGMDESFFLYFEDVDLCLRIRKVGWRVVYFPMAQVVHLQRHSTSKVSDIARRASLESACIYLRKHYGIGAVIAFKLLTILREWILTTFALVVHSPFKPAWRRHFEAVVRILCA
jgi:GT2 family glycosyltransferase